MPSRVVTKTAAGVRSGWGWINVTVTLVHTLNTPVPSLEEVGTTHHSVELAWGTPAHSHTATHRPLYTVQEEEVGKGRGYTNIYRLVSMAFCHCVNAKTTLHSVRALSVATQLTAWPQA